MSRVPHHVSRTVWRSLVGLAPLVAVAACTVDPPSSEELREELANAPVPPAWTAQGVAAGAVEGNWLVLFGDAKLNGLVEEALKYNGDLRAAAARAEQAAALVRVAGGELYPAVGALARGGTGDMSGDNSGLEGWLLSASWELDLWRGYE